MLHNKEIHHVLYTFPQQALQHCCSTAFSKYACMYVFANCFLIKVAESKST